MKKKSSQVHISKVLHCSYVLDFKLLVINFAKHSNNLKEACTLYKGKDMTWHNFLLENLHLSKITLHTIINMVTGLVTKNLDTKNML